MTQFLFLLDGVIGALVVAFAYITLAANAEANHEDRVLSVPLIGPELAAFLRALHGAAGECVVEGNKVEVFQNGDEIFPPMLAAIRAKGSPNRAFQPGSPERVESVYAIPAAPAARAAASSPRG